MANIETAVIFLAVALTFQGYSVFVIADCMPNSDTEMCVCQSSGVLDCSSLMYKEIPAIRDKTLFSVSFQRNEITLIRTEDFAGFAKLMTLDLSFNKIKSIEDDAFSDLNKLDSLLLDNNELTQLGSEHFMRLLNLKNLILRNNDDLTIDPCLFSQLPTLRALAIDGTKIDFDSALVYPTDECRQRFPSTDDEFKYVSFIRSLFVGFEGTSSDSKMFIHFPLLDTLSIKAFPSDSFVDADVSVSRHLFSLTLESMRVFPRDFLNSETLTQLHVTKSLFPCLPEEALANLPSLRTVQFRHNALKVIHPTAFRNISRVENINLSFNELRSLPYDVFDDVGNATFFPKLAISGNEWRCDCRLKWFKEFLETDPRVGPSSNSLITCHTPIELRGSSLLQVNFDFCEDDDNLDDYDDGDYEDDSQLCLQFESTSPRTTTTTTSSPDDELFTPTILGIIAIVILCIFIIGLSVSIWLVHVKQKKNNGVNVTRYQQRRGLATKAGVTGLSRSDGNTYDRAINNNVYNDHRLYDQAPTLEQMQLQDRDLGRTTGENDCNDSPTPTHPYSLVTGYKTQNMFLLTQTPMENTIGDFWRMVYDYKASIIVSLDDATDMDWSVAQYWPMEDELHVFPFEIKTTNSMALGDIYRREFSLRNEKAKYDDTAKAVTQFEIQDWSIETSLPNHVTLLSLIDMVEDAHREGNAAPIVIHCRTGVYRSGLFCAVYTAIAKLKSELKVDVFHVVKNLRKCNKRIVSDEDEYLFCLEMLEACIESSQILVNGKHSG